MIRPPWLVDRLVVTELTRDAAGLALVYLNELGTASAAFSLHAPEAKQSKLWLDHLRKAQLLYAEAKAKARARLLYPTPPPAPPPPPPPRPTSAGVAAADADDDDLDFPSSALLNAASRSPRPGSSRASRGSSLVHSHRYATEATPPKRRPNTDGFHWTDAADRWT